MKCRIPIDGRVIGCAVLESTVPVMNEAVIQALEKRRYKPATLRGEPVEVDYNFRINLETVP